MILCRYTLIRIESQKKIIFSRIERVERFQNLTFNEQMKKYCAACDIQNGEYLFKSHDYRHTVATNLYDHGVSRQGIRDYLGHNYEEMTMQYIDYMPKKVARRNVEYFSDEKNSLLSYVQKGEKDERKS